MPGQLISVPVLHGRLEFAVAVRQAINATNPDCIAVELPETLTKHVLRGVARLPLLSIVQYMGGPTEKKRPVYLPIEPADPTIEALRWGMERDVPMHLVDQDIELYGHHEEPFPDPYSVKRLGHAMFCEAYHKTLDDQEVDPADAGREAVMAFHLRELLQKHERVLFVCGLVHARRVQARLDGEDTGVPLRRLRRDGVTLYHLSEASSREVMAEVPFLSQAFEEARDTPAALDGVDRLGENVKLAQRARDEHEKNSGDVVPKSALGIMFRFARNYALVESRLTPDLFQVLVAARGAVDDNYAWEVWNIATEWPHQTKEPELPVINLSIEDLYKNARYMRFRRKIKRRRRCLLNVVKARPEEGRPGEWKDGWKGDAICSYQPEDIVVESYGDFLKKKAKGIMSAENSRVEPFTTSLLDGIDVRETLRNWHEQRLYVREQQLIKGDVGSVVVIFDEDDADVERYPWCITWQGEHEQESDMALYSTATGEKMVGPGISYCEYGGFMLTYPPGRMYHVFEDPYFEAAESKSERLLMAGIEYSEERLVVYVAAKPPRTAMRSFAERFGKKVVYLPLGDLSPLSLKQIRVFHVLDNHPVRAWAKEYIR